jgi:hypothetical protein
MRSNIILLLLLLWLAPVGPALSDNTACVKTVTSGYCGTNQGAVQCLCMNANPPTEGDCEGDFTKSFEGLWNAVPCPPGDENCTLYSTVDTVCTRSYFCRRDDSPTHVYCLYTSDCKFYWTEVWTHKLVESLGPCTGEPD